MRLAHWAGLGRQRINQGRCVVLMNHGRGVNGRKLRRKAKEELFVILRKVVAKVRVLIAHNRLSE